MAVSWRCLLLLASVVLCHWSATATSTTSHSSPSDVAQVVSEAKDAAAQLGVDKKKTTTVSNDNVLVHKSVTETLPPASPPPLPPLSPPPEDPKKALMEKVYQTMRNRMEDQMDQMHQIARDTDQFIKKENKDLTKTMAEQEKVLNDAVLKHMQKDAQLHEREHQLDQEHLQHNENVEQQLHELGIEKADKIRQYELDHLDLEKQRLEMEKQQLEHWNKNENAHVSDVTQLQNKWHQFGEKKLQTVGELHNKWYDIRKYKLDKAKQQQDSWHDIKTQELDKMDQQVKNTPTKAPQEAGELPYEPGFEGNHVPPHYGDDSQVSGGGNPPPGGIPVGGVPYGGVPHGVPFGGTGGSFNWVPGGGGSKGGGGPGGGGWGGGGYGGGNGGGGYGGGSGGGGGYGGGGYGGGGYGGGGYGGGSYGGGGYGGGYNGGGSGGGGWMPSTTMPPCYLRFRSVSMLRGSTLSPLPSTQRKC